MKKSWYEFGQYILLDFFVYILLIMYTENFTFAELLTFVWNFDEFFSEFFYLECSDCCKGLFPKSLVILLARLIGSLRCNTSRTFSSPTRSQLRSKLHKVLRNCFLKEYKSNTPKCFRWKKLFWKCFTLLRQFHANHTINWE